MTAVATVFGQRIPAAVGARWPWLGALLRDGPEFPGLPVGRGLLMPGALVLGLATAPLRGTQETFTGSLLVLLLLVAAGSLGAGVGYWAWLGYVIGDVLLFQHLWSTQDPISHILVERVPQGVIFVLLFIGIVVIPSAAAVLREDVLAPFGRRAGIPVQAVTQAVIAGLLTAAWVIGLPPLRGIFWLWRGVGPPADDVALLRSSWPVIAIVAAIVTGIRVGLPMLGARAPGVTAGQASPTPAASGGRRWVTLLLQAGVGTLLFGAFITGIVEAVVLLVGLFAAMALAREWLPRLPGYVGLVARLPVVVRLALVAAAAYLVTPIALGQSLGDSYLPFSILVVVGALLSALLFPSGSTARTRAAA